MTEEEIKSMIEGELPKHLRPKEIVYVNELPRNHAFKVDRQKLVKQFS